MKSMSTIPYYYMEYSGHEIDHLQTVYRRLREQDKRIIFLAGDSSLDNKYWFNDEADALNGYETLLNPPIMKQDIDYWLNNEIIMRGYDKIACLNTAIEATSLNSRAFCLPDQDCFIRDNITSDDQLIVSVGGNDIALQPLICTIFNLSMLICCVPECCTENCAFAWPLNCHFDCGCVCCGLPGCLAGLLGWPIGFGYFVDLFQNRIQNYLNKLVSIRKPKKIIVCMIYYPNERSGGSWADTSLGCMCQDCCPSKLQTAIRKVFEKGVSNIKIPGTEVIPFPLFRLLDGKHDEDQVQRVEPSPIGGKKMAKAFLDKLRVMEYGNETERDNFKINK